MIAERQENLDLHVTLPLLALSGALTGSVSGDGNPRLDECHCGARRARGARFQTLSTTQNINRRSQSSDRRQGLNSTPRSR